VCEYDIRSRLCFHLIQTFALPDKYYYFRAQKTGVHVLEVLLFCDKNKVKSEHMTLFMVNNTVQVY